MRSHSLYVNDFWMRGAPLALWRTVLSREHLAGPGRKYLRGAPRHRRGDREGDVGGSELATRVIARDERPRAVKQLVDQPLEGTRVSRAALQRERGEIEDDREIGCERLRQRRDDLILALGSSRDERRADDLPGEGDRGKEQLLLGREVAIERPLCHPDRLADVIDRDVGIAMAGECRHAGLAQAFGQRG